MNKKQLGIIKRITSNFEEAGKVGLSIGIFDGSLCFWESGNPPISGDDFWESLEQVGGCRVYVYGVYLDGGAGY